MFVDIDPATRNIDLERVEAAITPRDPRDHPGRPGRACPSTATGSTPSRGRHGLRVVEDAAQAFGSTWKGRRIGSFGDFVSFSFHPNKNITTIEGGCLVLNDEREASSPSSTASRASCGSGHDGMEVEVLGGKFNLTDVAARVGLGQLPHLEEFTARRRELARAYFEEFWTRPGVRALGLGLPIADFENSNWHMFQVLLPEERLTAQARRASWTRMHEPGIGTGVHYPAIHLLRPLPADGLEGRRLSRVRSTRGAIS